MTFSRTVMSLITWTIWNVRAIPSLQILCALAVVMSFPRKRTFPASGR